MFSLYRSLPNLRASAHDQLSILLRLTATAAASSGPRAPTLSRGHSPQCSLSTLRKFWSRAAASAVPGQSPERRACGTAPPPKSCLNVPTSLQLAAAVSRPDSTNGRMLHSCPPRSVSLSRPESIPQPSAGVPKPSEASAGEVQLAPEAPTQQPGDSIQPWTFTRNLQKRKLYTKRVANMLTVCFANKYPLPLLLHDLYLATFSSCLVSIDSTD